MRLLTVNNQKINKSKGYGWMTFGLHLAPYTLSGRNVCPYASKGCAEACLNTAGRGQMHAVQQARINKTKLFHSGKATFLQFLNKDIYAALRKADKANMKPCFRLNLTSDISWEKYGVIQNNPDVQFYDYTKNIKRIDKFLNKELPENYHLTYSRSEDTDIDTIKDIIKRKGNVAVCFNENINISKWKGMDVTNGDTHDLRFIDPKSHIISLKAKGKATKDQSGFTVYV